jgi:hypothetical protein
MTSLAYKNIPVHRLVILERRLLCHIPLALETVKFRRYSAISSVNGANLVEMRCTKPRTYVWISPSLSDADNVTVFGTTLSLSSPRLMSAKSWLTKRTRSFPGSSASHWVMTSIIVSNSCFRSYCSHSSRPSTTTYSFGTVEQNISKSCFAIDNDRSDGSPLVDCFV